MTDEWIGAAGERCSLLGLDLDEMLTGYQMLCAAVGLEWLEEQEGVLHRVGRTLSDVPPLVRNMVSSSDTALVETCEIAHYLKTFQRDSAIDSVVHDLKSTLKYEPTLLEIAIANRWQAGGATISLRPPTPRGEADFTATIEGLAFTVEVSGFPNDVFTSPQMRWPAAVMDAVKSVLRGERPVIVRVSVETALIGNAEAELRGTVRAACKKLLDASGGGQPVGVLRGGLSVEVEDLTPDLLDFPVDGPIAGQRTPGDGGRDWSITMQSVAKPQPPGMPLRHLVQEPGTETIRLFMEIPVSETRSREQRILRKLKREEAQLRGIATPRGVVLDVGAVGDVFMQVQSEELRNMLRGLMRSIPELACVWLVMRKWTTASRFKYFGLFVPNDASVYQLPASFLHRYTEYEWRWDFLAGREFVGLDDVTNPFAAP